MASVTILNIQVLNNPAKFSDQYEFEITFECLTPIKEDLEWKLVYVGSATSPEYDQELECLLVGPIPVGINKFVFSADAPRADLIPQNDLVSVTIMLLTCSYRDQTFVQVGYFVNNEYDTEELRENPPTNVALDHVVRNLLADKPKVTRFQIAWDNEQVNEYPPEQPDVDFDDEDEYGNEEEDQQDDQIDNEDEDEAEESGEDEESDNEDDEDDEDLDNPSKKHRPDLEEFAKKAAALATAEPEAESVESTKKAAAVDAKSTESVEAAPEAESVSQAAPEAEATESEAAPDADA